jgi:hypothetical protein
MTSMLQPQLGSMPMLNKHFTINLSKLTGKCMNEIT